MSVLRISCKESLIPFGSQKGSLDPTTILLQILAMVSADGSHAATLFALLAVGLTSFYLFRCLKQPAVRSLRSVTQPSSIVRQAAFDIGSGASKVLVADVDASRGVIVGAPIYQTELPLSFKADAQQSADGSLSPDIFAKGLNLIEALAVKAKELGATSGAGIATEVFRSAPNGLAFLAEVEQRTGVNITTLSQEHEARLGLATAEVLLGGPYNVCASWDSGGGSFQITARAASPDLRAEDIGSADLRTYVGKLGTAPSFHRLVTSVQQQPYSLSARPNPVKPTEADALITLLTAELEPSPSWLRGSVVVAIGGWNSIFAVTLRVLRLLVGGAYALPGEDGESGGTGGGMAAGGMMGGSFSLDDARKALAAVCDRGDEALLQVSGTSAEAESVSFVVPKVALLVAVASHLGIARIEFTPATGGCAGLMALGNFTPLPPFDGGTNGTRSCESR